VLRHKLGSQTNSWLKKRFLRALLAGHDEQTINAWALSFSQNVISSGLYSDALACMKQHQASGAELVLLSASLDIYVEPLGEMLGFKNIICTRTTWDNDVLGGELDGGNCYGETKLKRIHQWLEGRAASNILAAYGDHETDFPLLKIAQRGIVVNPDAKLTVKAKENQLELVNWE
jgi:HAD superfamily hydrolase (TIGR01490 family)